jgi:hypothetical protein
MSEYKYQLISTRDSSAKYGNCEVCKSPASEVFHQIESRRFKNGWTYAECHNIFGHESCLRSKRRMWLCTSAGNTKSRWASMTGKLTTASTRAMSRRRVCRAGRDAVCWWDTKEMKTMENHYCPEHGAQLEEIDGKYVCTVCGYEEWGAQWPNISEDSCPE